MQNLYKVLFSLAFLCISNPGIAQTYPTKPVRVIVPTRAGGTQDLVARIVMPEVSNLLGQQFIIDNRGGAGGHIGAELVMRASPDGHTLMFSSGGVLTILPLVRQVSFDPFRDFSPVNLVSSGPFVLVTHPSTPFGSIKELIALSKANPRKFNYASAGNGSPNHLATELFKSMAGVLLTHVPYQSASAGVIDLLGQHIDLNFSSITPILQHLKTGRLRALGVSSLSRSTLLPDIPTISEAGVSGYEFVSWFGLLAPTNTPAAVISLLNGTLQKVLRDPRTQSQFTSLGQNIAGKGPNDFSVYIRNEFKKNSELIKSIGLKEG